MSRDFKHGDYVPSELLARRLDELCDAIGAGPDAMAREFTRRIPAELDRDADLVLMQAAERIRELEVQVQSLQPAI